MPVSVREYALRERRLAGTSSTHPARPRRHSELDLLRQRQGIIDFDPEVTDGALDLRMSEKQLDRSQIAGLAVDLRRRGAAHRMRAIRAAVHPCALDPTLHDARILAGRHMGLIVDAAGEDIVPAICRAHVQPVLQRGAGLLHDLELNQTAGFVLDNCRSVSHVSAGCDVVDPKADEIAAAQLGVMARLNIARSRLRFSNLKSDANGPDLFWPEGTLLADETALVPRRARTTALGLDFGGHG